MVTLKSREVGLLAHESLELSSIADLNLSNPSVLLGAGVDSLSVVLQDGVTLDDLAGDRGEDIGSRLDGLDSTDGLTSGDLEVSLGELNEDDVTEGVGGVLGDTDFGCKRAASVYSSQRLQYTGAMTYDNGADTYQCWYRQRAQSTRATRCTSSPEL